MTVFGAEVFSRRRAGTAAATPPAAQAGAPAAGRGGGRGNPTAQLFNEVCAGCHGATAAAGPRAPSLLANTWLHGSDDESIAKNIRDGFPEKGMVPFKDTLTDQQIWQMVAYLRTQTANLKDKPVYVPDPDGQVVTSEKQTFRMEIVARNLETPWGLAFLPDGRLLITERPGRLRIVQDGKLLPEPVKGTPKVWEKQDGGLLDLEVHPDYARNGWIYLSYSETLPGYVAPPPPPPPAADAPPPPAGARRTRRSARPAVDDGRRPRQDQQGQRVGRAAAALPRARRDLQLEERALRIALHLRQGQSPLLLDRRQAADAGRAGSVEADRQDPSHQRRRDGAEGQPVRESRRRAADHLELRPPQSAGFRLGSR